MNEASKTALRQRILIGTALAIMGLYAIFSVLDARAAAQRLELAQQDLAEVKDKLAQIKLLSAAPSVAAFEDESPGAILARVEAALEETATTKKGSTPLGQPTQIQGTQYKSRKSEIVLNPATISDIVNFCDALVRDDSSSVVSFMQLTPPRNAAGSGGRELWNATLTLTQTIYSPKSE